MEHFSTNLDEVFFFMFLIKFWSRPIMTNYQLNSEMHTLWQYTTSLFRTKDLDIDTSCINAKYWAKVVDFSASVALVLVISIINLKAFFPFTCDGSTDLTGDDFETIYVRTCMNGIVWDQFFLYCHTGVKKMIFRILASIPSLVKISLVL